MSLTTGQAAKQGAQQAVSGTGRMLHGIVQFLLAVVVVAVIGVCVLAIRLAQGPLDVAWLARRVTTMAVSPDGGTSVSIGGATLSWQGLQGGSERPLNLVLTDLAIRDLAGEDRATVQRAAGSLALGELFLGRIALRTVNLEGARLKLRRAVDGKTTLDLGGFGDSADDMRPSSGPSAMQALTAPPAKVSSRAPSLWSYLQDVHIHDLSIAVDDRQLGTPWSVPSVEVNLTRAAGGGASGTALATVAMGTETLTIDSRLVLLPDKGGLTVSAMLSKTVPARLATLAPLFAPLAAVDAPLDLSGTASLDDRFMLRNASVKAVLDAGFIHAGTGGLPIKGATITADGTPSALNLHLQDLKLQPREEAPPSNFNMDVAATRANGIVSAKVIVDVDQAAFADLPIIWPAGVGGPGTRPWVTENITAGIAHNGHVELSLTAPEDFSDAKLSSIVGGIDGSDVSVHWLRPVPPIQHGEAKVVFIDPDTIDVLISAGQQGVSKLALKPSKVRITGISGHDQFLAITANIFGPFGDLVTLLKHPKVGLLDKRPIDMTNPTGQVTGLLTVNMPLKTDLTMDKVVIHATGKLANGHAGAIAVGRDIDNAALDYDVNNQGLVIKGTANIATIPATLKIDMDFRDGGPTQVMQNVAVTAMVDPKQIAALGLDTGTVLAGALPVQLNYFDRRDKTGDITAHADLGPAGIEGGRFPWRKVTGTPGSLDAHILLKGGKLASIEHIDGEGPGLSILVNADAAGGRANLVHIQRLIIGDTTNVTGDVRFPDQDGQPYVVNLAGQSLDASSEFDRKTEPKQEGKPDSKGSPFKVNVKIGKIGMAGGRTLVNVQANVENDGSLTNVAHVSGIAGTGRFSLDITPDKTGRLLSAEAQDAGAMLRTVDVIKTMSGGRLSVHGAYDDTDAAHPLHGTASIDDFRMRDAPSIGRILKGMSLYGLIDLAQGPGLGFTRMVAPFQLSREVLTIGDARAYSPSLGMTVKGTIDLSRNMADLTGTVIPAYFFNSLLGRVPLLGRLFSPEAGGGVFAATYSVTGKLDNPDVGVNPLAVLTPGFLRGFFDVFDTGSPSGSGSKQAPTIAEHQR